MAKAKGSGTAAKVTFGKKKKGVAKKSLGIIFKYTNIYGIEVETKINYSSKIMGY